MWFSNKKMYIFIIICVVFLLSFSIFIHNTPSMKQRVKHMTSSITGLNRHVILYDSSGKIIREWNSKTNIEDNGGTCRFLNDKGCTVIISGTFIIEEN